LLSSKKHVNPNPSIVNIIPNDLIFGTCNQKQNVMEILATIIIGAVAGWLATLIYKGGSLGTIGNIIVGIIGSFVGYWLLGLFNISLGTGILGVIITAVIGAIAVLFLINLFSKSKSSI